MCPQSYSSMNFAIEREFDTSYEKRTRNIKSFKMRVIQFIVFSFLLKFSIDGNSPWGLKYNSSLNLN